MIEPGVDGYGPEQYDGFHWEHCIGAGVAIALAVVLAGLWAGAGAASHWLLVVAAMLIVLSVGASRVSSSWRRYRYLIWWKKCLVILLGIVAIMGGAILAVIGGFLSRGYDTRSYRSTMDPDYSRSQVRREKVPVDKDGNVYRWNAWRGRWDRTSTFVDLGRPDQYPLRTLFHIERGKRSPEGSDSLINPPKPYEW